MTWRDAIFGNFPILKTIKIAIPLAIILGLGIALWMAKRDANAWHHAYTAAVAAGRASEQRQIAANAAQEARWARSQEKTDAEYQKALGDAVRRSERFIAARSLRAICPRLERGADPLPETESPEGVDGPGGLAGMVAVRLEDVNICTTNTLRLQAAVEWAKGL